MASSLSTLTSNFFNFKDLPFVTRKGVCPYEYTECLNSLKEICLPSTFYSKLTETKISDGYYKYAEKVQCF